MPDKKVRTKPTRREFLKDAAVLGSAVLVGRPAEALTAPVTPTAAPPAPQTSVTEAQVQLPKATGYIDYNPALCAGCRTCMAVCSLFHDGVINPELARIQVIAPVAKIFETQAITCKQCNDPNCLQSCPVQAISVDSKTGARVIDPKKCQGLQLCIKACPQYPNSPIRFDAARKIAIKCDLCGGDPQCVKYCPKSVSLTPHYIPEKDRVLRFVKTL